MLCEAAEFYKDKGMTLIDALNELFAEHGFFQDALDNFTFKGLDGGDKIKALVDGLRNDPPTKAGDVAVTKLEDYTSKEMLDLGFPKSNVLRFILADGSWVAVRPSGTEPKCKFYFSVVADTYDDAMVKLKDMRAVFEKDC